MSENKPANQATFTGGFVAGTVAPLLLLAVLIGTRVLRLPLNLDGYFIRIAAALTLVSGTVIYAAWKWRPRSARQRRSQQS